MCDLKPSFSRADFKAEAVDQQFVAQALSPSSVLTFMSHEVHSYGVDRSLAEVVICIGSVF